MPTDGFRLLIVKTSSLGDVIHNLPMVEDIAHARPEVAIDWMVEEAYVGLLRLNPHIDRVIGTAQRRWRDEPLAKGRLERQLFKEQLRSCAYDMVLDSQGLLKSAVLARSARLTSGAVRAGFSFRSAREPLARLFYDRGYSIDPRTHAIERLRSLSGQALGYRPEGLPQFGLVVPKHEFSWLPNTPYAVFLHATARAEKKWPIESFKSLAAALCVQNGFTVVLPHGSDAEKADAVAIASAHPNTVVAPRMALAQMAALLNQAELVVGVDTGLSHLAAALGRPTVGLFGATPRWRYAPYWSPKAVSLGEMGQPLILDVIAASNTLLGAHTPHV